MEEEDIRDYSGNGDESDDEMDVEGGRVEVEEEDDLLRDVSL